MAKLNVKAQRWGGTVLAIPGLLLLALLAPTPILSAVALGLLLVGLSAQLLPLLTVPEATKSFRLAGEQRWAQARFYNILAQQKLRESPWKGGFRPFRTAHQASTLALALRADSGRLQLGLGQPRQAERVLRAVLKELPDHAPSHHNLAVALHAQGKYRQAKTALGQAIELGSVQPAWEMYCRARLSWLRPSLDRLDDRATFYQSLGFHEVALRCLSADREDVRNIWRRVGSLLALGRAGHARKEIWAELGERPDNSYAWLSLGFLRALEGCAEEALRAYARALGPDPAASSAKNLAVKEQIYALKARTSSPRSLLDSLAVVAEYEFDPRAQAMARALLLAALGHWQQALDQVVQAGPPSRRSCFYELIAYAHIERGLYESGCRLLHRFCLTSQISGLPMLDREQRLRRAQETLRRYRRSYGPTSFTGEPRTI